MSKTRKVLCGVKIGEHSKCREDILRELQERVVSQCCDIICLRPQKLE